MSKKYQPFIFKFFLILVFLSFFFFLYKIYSKRVNAFGCFDDCFNFAGGYFITQGKTLYSQIFFNHQPGMAYLSATIQKFTKPINLYDLVLKHRQSLFLFAAAFNIVLILRFGLAALFFSIFYETSKFYLFGDRFLAEGFIVYPFLYLLGLAINKLFNKKIYGVELIISGIFTWFILEMREPYILAAFFIYFILLWNTNFLKEKVISVVTLFLLVFLSVPLFNFKDYFFDLFVINSRSVVAKEIAGEKLLPFGILKVFFYPIFIFLNGEKTFFRQILILFNFTFIYIFCFLKNNLKVLLFIIFTLGLANLRIVAPGQMFYSSFHLLPWYSLFIFSPLLFLQNLHYKKAIYGIPLFLVFLLFIFFIFSKNSFLKEKIDPQTEFITNYGHLNQTGELIEALSNKTNTFFADGFNESLYPQINLTSPYKYSMYTSVMPYFDKFSKARAEMFKNNPPDFYYGNCPKDENISRKLPSFRFFDYINLKEFNKPSCIFIKKEIISAIKDQQWIKAQALGFNRP